MSGAESPDMTPWAEMVRVGMRLGLSPEGFWRLSLREWRMLTAGGPGMTPMGRLDFDRLTEAWPDEQ